MSVKHMYAKPGEYIAIHRSRRRKGNASSADSGYFYLFLLIAIIAIIVCFWEIIVACLIAAAALWLIWIFRAPLGKAVWWMIRQIGKLMYKAGLMIGKWIKAGWIKFKNWRETKKSNDVERNTEYNRKSDNYGKIIQY